mmetsp:Transcript_65655/g.148114  ORF Transcript_65655/g.148114 Transcript_65655/m.148114 type:complete len:224 (-) Transcript_65655:661-1332(-)
MVGVVARLAGQVPCLFPGQLLDINQEAHHLNHSHGRMGVIHLHRHLVWQLRPLAVWLLQEFPKEVLQRSANEEILLFQAKDFALILVVVGVKHGGQVLGPPPSINRISIVAFVECFEVELLGGARAPQTQIVGVVGVKPRDGVVVRHGLDDLAPHPALAPDTARISEVLDMATEAHGVHDVRAGDLEGVHVAKPEVRLLNLPAILDDLLEDAEAVADAVTPAW